MLELSKRLGICLGIAATFCLGACGDDDSSSDKGNTNGGGDGSVTCDSEEDCKDVADKPVCDPDKKICVEKKAEENQGGEGDGKCKSDADCKEDGKPKCDTASGECKAEENGGNESSEENGKCKSDADCKDAAKPKCDTESGECKADENGNNENNNSGQTKCTADTDCTDITAPVCDTVSGTCIAGNAQDGEETEQAKCETGQTECGEDCVDLTSNDKNCGECGKDCTANDKVCRSGNCVKECEASTELCGDDCIDLGSDKTCGTCEEYVQCDASKNLHCSPSKKCETACENSDGQLIFVDLNSDKAHCGSCSGETAVCGEKQKCDEGKCVEDCGTEKVAFGETCVDPKTDATHCGIDGRENPEGINCTALAGIAEAGTCDNGICKFNCDASHSDCDENAANGCEVDITSVDNCGGCGENFKCVDDNAEKASCIEGKCQFVCKSNMKSCDSKCTNVQSDTKNCGFCGHECPEGAVCSEGFCSIPASKCDSEGYVRKISVNEDETVDAYCIRSITELESMRDAINNGDIYPSENENNAYILVTDLNMGKKTWTPIGTDSKRFNGYFFGNGKKISAELTTTGSNTGIFGVTENAYLDGFNLKVSLNNTTNDSICHGGLLGRGYNTNISYSKNIGGAMKHTPPRGYTNSHSRMGLLVGRLDGQGCSVKYSDVSGTISWPAHYGCIGGLVGEIQGAKIHSCSADVTISMSRNDTYVQYVGGLIGHMNTDDSEIRDSWAKGKITIKTSRTDSNKIGGLTSYFGNASSIINSHSDVTIDAPNAIEVGGLVGGWYTAGKVSNIENSYATGNITARYQCGGLVGTDNSASGDRTIKSSYATGKVVCSSSYSGGLISYGYNVKIIDSHATGDVSGTTYTGGLVGYLYNASIDTSYATGTIKGINDGSNNVGGLSGTVHASTISNSYAKGEVSGGNDIGGLVGHLRNSSTIKKSAAFGNVQCATFNSKRGVAAGGLVGVATENTTIEHSFATGDVQAGGRAGSVVGGLARNNHSIKYVYGAGIVKTNDNNTLGGLLGLFDNKKIWGESNENANLSIQKSYYWQKAATTPIGASSSTPQQAQVYEFVYNNDKNSVLGYDDTRKLVQELGDDWMDASCNLKSGPKDTVTIPVPKSLGAEVCN